MVYRPQSEGIIFRCRYTTDGFINLADDKPLKGVTHYRPAKYTEKTKPLDQKEFSNIFNS